MATSNKSTLSRAPTSQDLEKTFNQSSPESEPEGSVESISLLSLNWFERILDGFKRSTGGAKQNPPQLSGFSLQMIAIGGCVGTGLFIGSGKALSEGGKLGTILAYLLVSGMVIATTQSLSELAVTFPVPGAFSYYSTYFIDESWGFAIGWNYAIQWLILLPLELVASSMTFRFWADFPISDVWLITIFFILIIIINMLPVKIYGYTEVLFSMTKIVAIVGFIISGLFVLLTNSDLVGTIWKEGYFSEMGFKGFISVFVTAAFSFSGTEMCGLCANETPNPRKSVPKSTNQVCWRVLGFYIVTLTICGLLVSSLDPRLVSREESNANSSPFVIALKNGDIPVLPSIMNIVILLAIVSVGNSAIYASSRTLVCLANAGQAPQIFGYIDKQGRPLFAILLCLLMGGIAYLSLIGDTATVIFSWLLSLSGLSSLFTWNSINFSYIRFRKSLRLQGGDKDELPHLSNTGVFGAQFGFGFTIVILVAQLWVAISPPGSDNFKFTEFFKVCLGAFTIFASFILHKAYLSIKTGNFHLLAPIEHLPVFKNRVEGDWEDQVINGPLFKAERDKWRSKPWYYRYWKMWC